MSQPLQQQSVTKIYRRPNWNVDRRTDRSFHHLLPFGAELRPNGDAAFRIWAPFCPTMQLRLDGKTVPMLAETDGWHSAVSPAPIGSEYSYVMPDGLNVPDPVSRMQQNDVHGSSVVIDPTFYQWRHPNWTGRPSHEAVIYELHVGLAGGFNAVRERLPELAALGATVIKLMPLPDVPSKRN